MNNITKCRFFKFEPLLRFRTISSTCITRNKDSDFGLLHPKGREPTIPEYTEKPNESIESKKARLLYQSRKRGMLENGLLLSTFAYKYLNKFSEEQLKLYDRLINLPSNDWDIFYWAVDVKPVPPEFDNEIMTMFKKHVKNENRETRFRQPDLF